MLDRDSDGHRTNTMHMESNGHIIMTMVCGLTEMLSLNKLPEYCLEGRAQDNTVVAAASPSHGPIMRLSYRALAHTHWHIINIIRFYWFADWTWCGFLWCLPICAHISNNKIILFYEMPILHIHVLVDCTYQDLISFDICVWGGFRIEFAPRPFDHK